MWLIDTATLRLRSFTNAEGIKYAILSHTWGPEEVSFQDINAQGDAAMSKKGSAKIVEACRIARERYQLDYAWVDTCCIDKTSSAELSEAINSMFAWYKASTVCLVFLEDENAVFCQHEGRPGLVSGTREFRERLGGARWFTRGWTLQELIAPSHVAFYDRYGKFFGTKQDLVEDLMEITRIDRAVLQNVDVLSEVPVARKMSWAASRQTTRIEDMAYCMLGVFDVNMALLYGEGEKAFLRLQEEIARSSNDLTLFVWKEQGFPSFGSNYTYRGIFAVSPAEFCGCHKFKVPDWTFDQDVSITLTNRGVCISNKVRVDETGSTLLYLDCLESPPSKWVAVWLKKVGPVYFRVDPHFLDEAVWTPRKGSGSDDKAAGWLEEPIFIAKTAPQAVLTKLSSRPTLKNVSLVYHESLRNRTVSTPGERWHKCDLAASWVQEEASWVSLQRHFNSYTGRGSWKILRQSWGHEPGSELHQGFLARNMGETVCAREGFKGGRYHHLFDVQLNLSNRSVRLALVWGLFETNLGDPRYQYYPWAILLRQRDLVGSQDDPMFYSGRFNQQFYTSIFNTDSTTDGVTLSDEEKLEILHNFVFERYTDEAGVYKVAEMPTSVRIRDHNADASEVVWHEIRVRVAFGIQYDRVYKNDQLSLVLSHQAVPGSKG
ncbi:heterokaryon incompatibility protein-domain-containing protein [Podospora aff. communis PSN243]|uniref:Heterokaryon incompatibility protein-domain-containing protein n=1 Tax=Podospora aff. communis PSN243 TaxID=3040156 RepID=A0AAV9GP95_9PEZI|nr:heterokaryon incompatibility protein-domain-containing protein [Podospora aff. communis PSN243]